MSSFQNMVCMTSYHAATAYIKYTNKKENEFLILGSDLTIFAKYFSNYTKCKIIKDDWKNNSYWSLLQSIKPKKITYWGYALSDTATLTAHYANCNNIEFNLVLPSKVGDDLYETDELDIKILTKNWRSLPKMLFQKVIGWPIKLKTFDNYLYNCIDLKPNQSVKKYKQLISEARFTQVNYLPFAEYVKTLYPEIVQKFQKNSKVCVMLDENLELFIKRTNNNLSDLKNLFLDTTKILKSKNYKICLKPTYYDKPDLLKYLEFDFIIPGKIPLQALDLMVPKGVLVTGLSATFIEEKTKNLRPISIARLNEVLA